MKYENIEMAKFIARPNRFIANIELDGREEVCHVCNTGRCRELLIPGAEVLINRARNVNRRTQYDLIAVFKGNRLINMDSGAPNQVFSEWARESGFFPADSLIRPEYKCGDSRLDFFIAARDRKILVEVKGVTLENDGVALFPDAPTQRGIKHINSLCQWVEKGHEGFIFFVIQMQDVRHFSPNNITHPAFGEALQKAAAAGVKIMALDCLVTPDSITAHDLVEVRLYT